MSTEMLTNPEQFIQSFETRLADIDNILAGGGWFEFLIELTPVVGDVVGIANMTQQASQVMELLKSNEKALEAAFSNLDACIERNKRKNCKQSVDSQGRIRNGDGTYAKDPLKVDEESGLQRPYLRKDNRDAIDATGKTPDGKWVDANTGEVFDGPKHYGHTYGHEHRRLVKEAEAKGMTQNEFNDWVNDHPEWFQIEKPSNNSGHKFEKPGNN